MYDYTTVADQLRLIGLDASLDDFDANVLIVTKAPFVAGVGDVISIFTSQLLGIFGSRLFRG